MPVEWAHWLEKNVPSVTKKVILEGAKLFFPEEEEAERFNAELREFFTS
jgi:hypothetical protein